MNKPISTPSGDHNNSSSNVAAPNDNYTDLSSLFHYPSLGRLFEGATSASALAEMRSRLTRSHQELERVVRQGTPEDAARATRAARAYAVTLSLLDELEKLQRAGGGATTK
ncbi:MAG TPA: hypothetical protein VF666_10530 [Pyrinomonadaceae bacterium]|jgi:hypothetical protein